MLTVANERKDILHARGRSLHSGVYLDWQRTESNRTEKSDAYDPPLLLPCSDENLTTDTAVPCCPTLFIKAHGFMLE